MYVCLSEQVKYTGKFNLKLDISLMKASTCVMSLLCMQCDILRDLLMHFNPNQRSANQNVQILDDECYYVCFVWENKLFPVVAVRCFTHNLI